MPRIKAKPRKLNRKTRPVRLVMGGKKRAGLNLRRGKLGWHRGEVNYASVKESYNYFVTAGNMNYFQDALVDLNFDRAQAVAQAYQQYRIKYFKLYIKPNNDTYPSGGGAVVPNMYYMIDKSRAIPLNATFNTLMDLGAKPRRIDDYTQTIAFKPAVLTADKDGNGTVSAAQIRVSPWLSTNANAGFPNGLWAPDETIHGVVLYGIEKVNPGDAQQYAVTVEVMFEFRRPNWKTPSPGESNTLSVINYQGLPEQKPPAPTQT